MTDDSLSAMDHPPRSLFTQWGINLSRLFESWYVMCRQGLPLFRREMLMQSVQTRTYIIRAVFACVLFVVALCYASAVTGTSIIGAAVRLPGQGRVILDALVWMLFGFIYLFVPATASGVITLERERQTLVLLYLTKLTAWQIVLEKFLSRLLPLLAILLLAMPLLVFAYVFGGVSVPMLGTAMWFLLVTALQVTAVAVLCSTLCRRTTQALIVTYGVLLVLYLGPLLFQIWFFEGTLYDYFNPTRFASLQPVPVALNNGSLRYTPLPALPVEYLPFACFPAVLFAVHYELAVLGTNFGWRTMFMAGTPGLLSAAGCLFVAPFLVFYRAFNDQRSSLLEWTKQLAGRCGLSLRRRLPSAANGGQLLANLPLDEPIAWRESTKGTRSWLVCLLLLEMTALILVVWLAKLGAGSSGAISVEICGLWAVSALFISAHAASLITRERSQQTLDLLLTTPLTSAQIVQQKFRGIRNLMIVCAIPLFSCNLFQAWWRSQLSVPLFQDQYRLPGVFLWWEYLITSAGLMFIYFQLIGWIALWAGLKNKSSTRATLQAVVGLVCFSCIPQFLLLIPLVILFPVQIVTGYRILDLLVVQISPVVMIGLAEFTNLRLPIDIPLLPALFNFGYYGTLLLGVRKYVLDRADVLLGRTVYY